MLGHIQNKMYGFYRLTVAIHGNILGIGTAVLGMQSEHGFSSLLSMVQSAG